MPGKEKPILLEGEEYLTARDAAEFLGVSPSTFAKYQGDYHLTHQTKLGWGQTKLFRKSDLEKLPKLRPGEPPNQK